MHDIYASTINQTRKILSRERHYVQSMLSALRAKELHYVGNAMLEVVFCIMKQLKKLESFTLYSGVHIARKYFVLSLALTHTINMQISGMQFSAKI